MNYIITKKFGVSKLELWFDEVPIGLNVDIVKHVQSLYPRNGAHSEDFYTLLHRLSEDEATLFSRIKPKTRAQILRADHDGLEFKAYEPTGQCIQSFCTFFNDFAKSKSREPISCGDLHGLAEAGMLKLTAAEKDGEALVRHSLIFTPRRARGLQSASFFRALEPSMSRAIGRANRWLIWQDILYFKRLGVMEFDFGGWYEGKEDTERLRINEFKEFFGAEIEKNYNLFYATTLKGALYLRLLPLLSRLRRLNRLPG